MLASLMSLHAVEALTTLHLVSLLFQIFILCGSHLTFAPQGVASYNRWHLCLLPLYFHGKLCLMSRLTAKRRPPILASSILQMGSKRPLVCPRPQNELYRLPTDKSITPHDSTIFLRVRCKINEYLGNSFQLATRSRNSTSHGRHLSPGQCYFAH